MVTAQQDVWVFRCGFSAARKNREMEGRGLKPIAHQRSLWVFASDKSGAFRESMQHEPNEGVSWCDDVARA